MNLEICEKQCGINAVQHVHFECQDDEHEYLTSREATICDLYYHERYDMPCQNYDGWLKKWKSKITVEKKPDLDWVFYFKNDVQTKCFHVPPSCPFFVEHSIFDEN